MIDRAGDRTGLTTVSTTMTREDNELVERMAERAGRTKAGYIRDAILDALERDSGKPCNRAAYMSKAELEAAGIDRDEIERRIRAELAAQMAARSTRRRGR